MQQKKTLSRVLSNEIERLQQIAQILSDLGPENRRMADELYNTAMGIMIASAPTPLQTEWHKIEMSHLKIMSEQIVALTHKSLRQDEELTEEEELMYLEVIGDQPFPSA